MPSAQLNSASSQGLPTGMDAEVTFISGVDASGATAATSFDAWNGNNPASYSNFSDARKWGGGAAGSAGGTVSYSFDQASNWTAAEKLGFIEGLTLWSDVANIKFVAASSASSANITFKRGNDGSAYEYDNAPGEAVGSKTINPLTSATISMDTSVYGWQRPGSFTDAGGYDMDTIVHEEGHALGLGHAGPYNGAVDPATQQFGAYDSRQWSLMSYIEPEDTSGKYYGSSSASGTSWHYRDPTTFMPADILAIQRLYGVATSTPLSGGQTFGFNCNVSGASKAFFDFTTNPDPIVTLWDAGGGNTLDISGFSQAATVNLNPGCFSSCDGMVNNIGIAFGTKIDTLVLGAGSDTLTSNADGDTFKTTLSNLNGDTFKNFSLSDKIVITDANINSFSSAYGGGTLMFGVGGATSYQASFSNLGTGSFSALADSSGTGVDLVFSPNGGGGGGSSGVPSVAITSGGGLTNQKAKIVTGTVDKADAGTLVSVYDNGSSTALGTATVAATGTWSANLTLSGDGPHSLVARDTNTAGTGSSTPIVYTLDTAAPTVSITSKGGAVKSASLVVTGTVDTADAGTVVSLYDGNGSNPIGTAAVGNNGTWSAHVTLKGTGTHLLTARDTDAAGNVGTSKAVKYTLQGGSSTRGLSSSADIVTGNPRSTIDGMPSYAESEAFHHSDDLIDGGARHGHSASMHASDYGRAADLLLGASASNTTSSSLVGSSVMDHVQQHASFQVEVGPVLADHRGGTTLAKMIEHNNWLQS